jgi:hypothetical protein
MAKFILNLLMLNNMCPKVDGFWENREKLIRSLGVLNIPEAISYRFFKLSSKFQSRFVKLAIFEIQRNR